MALLSLGVLKSGGGGRDYNLTEKEVTHLSTSSSVNHKENFGLQLICVNLRKMIHLQLKVQI